VDSKEETMKDIHLPEKLLQIEKVKNAK